MICVSIIEHTFNARNVIEWPRGTAVQHFGTSQVSSLSHNMGFLHRGGQRRGRAAGKNSARLHALIPARLLFPLSCEIYTVSNTLILNPKNPRLWYFTDEKAQRVVNRMLKTDPTLRVREEQ